MISEWIDITTCEDGADRVLMHQKTGQRKTVKPAERTALDDAYDAYWNHPSSRLPTDDLLATVRSFAINQVRGKVKDPSRSEDIAQESAMIIFEGLESFRRADETAFTRWVRRTVRRVMLEEFRTASIHTREFNEAATEPPEEEKYADVSRLPKEFRRIAGLIISGYSLDEVAKSKNITTAALRKKIQRYRDKLSQN